MLTNNIFIDIKCLLGIGCFQDVIHPFNNIFDIKKCRLQALLVFEKLIFQICIPIIQW